MKTVKLFLIFLLSISIIAKSQDSYGEKEPTITRFYLDLGVVQHSYKNDKGYTMELIKLFKANPFAAKKIEDFWLSRAKKECQGRTNQVIKEAKVKMEGANTEEGKESIIEEGKDKITACYRNYYSDNWNKINNMILSEVKEAGVRTEEEETPKADKTLVEEVKRLDVKGVKDALNEGANPNWISDEGRRMTLIDALLAYSLAHRVDNGADNVESRILKILKLLFKHGARLQYRDKGVLHFPILQNQPKVVEFLLNQGANPNGPLEGKTPIEVAEQNGHEKIVKILKKFGGRGIDSSQAIQLRFIDAANTCNILGMKKGIRNGADINEPTDDGELAIVEAARGVCSPKAKYEAIKFLLENKADPNKLGSSRFQEFGKVPALHMVVFLSHVSNKKKGFMSWFRRKPDYTKLTLRELLKNGAFVSGKDEKGRTPLHIAAMWNRVKAAEVLLENNAKVMPEDNNGKTPLDYAKSGKMIKLLKDHGAKER